jgi:mono/diheme cytochrome c family protein
MEKLLRHFFNSACMATSHSAVIRRRWLGLIVVLAVGAGVIGWLLSSSSSAAPVLINGTPVPPVPTLNADQVTQGAALYAQNCASCHGPNLESVPNWRKALPDGSLPPPPQDSSGHSWHHPDTLLLRIIADGGDPAFHSKMPAFKNKLTVDQMRLILDFIKSKWDKDKREFQWWMTATNDGS